jgi:hypothetical protein
MPCLLANNRTVKDPETAANDFNNFPPATAENLNLHQVGSGDAILFLKKHIFCEMLRY